MINFWSAFGMLAMESNEVIGLRLARVSKGGWTAIDEIELMFREKIAANSEALSLLVSGTSPVTVVNRYREVAAGNLDRLSRAPL
jgi:hypothetical protein